MLRVDSEQVRYFERRLANIRQRSIPYAQRQTLNDTAFHARRVAVNQINDRFTLRNKWSERSLGVNRASGLDPRSMQAAMGSTLDYMRDQEFGGANRSPIPTTAASGEPESARTRRRPVRRANRVSNLQVARRVRSRNPKQQVIASVQDSIRHGRRPFILDGPSPQRGIYTVRGGRLGRRRGWPSGARLIMLQSLTRQPVRYRARPWLQPSASLAMQAQPTFYARALQFQLDRANR